MKLPQVLDEQLQEEFLKEYIKSGDSQVKETLILHNLRLVKVISNRYRMDNNPLRQEEDLFNEGVIGLMNSLDSYDPGKGSFSNHAATHIKATIRAYIRDKSKGLRVPAWVYESLYKIEAYRRHYTRDNNEKEPTIKEISGALKIPYRKVKELMDIEQNVTSLDVDISQEGEGITLGDMIEDPEGCFEDDVVESVFINGFIEQIKSYLRDEELEALRLNLGLNCKEHQLKEVARIINRDPGYTAEIRNKALRKIRRSAYAKQLEKELDEVTSWYSSPRYDTDRVTGGNPSSPVERIVIDREKKLKKLVKGES
ncbi:sigma-70 family RNA polymerase sigma factor [Gudongella sp. DL1XJH-153]|uniref:sigma-70 family RNA polymerase sigma factor n=1 Tax=Gudongella sp. DL1XJH-153 TaxID=3409804 RepID=UPI003BB7FC68